jgi:hypothetical protein
MVLAVEKILEIVLYLIIHLEEQKEMIKQAITHSSLKMQH